MNISKNKFYLYFTLRFLFYIFITIITIYFLITYVIPLFIAVGIMGIFLITFITNIVYAYEYEIIMAKKNGWSDERFFTNILLGPLFYVYFETIYTYDENGNGILLNIK